MRTFADLVHALSWRIAADVGSCVPQTKIVELHPGGSHDVLSVHEGLDSHVATIGRTGLLQAPGVDLNWADVLRLGTQKASTQLLAGAGMRNKRRPTTPARRTYRVLAEILSALLPDGRQWAVRSAAFDTAGGGVSIQQHLLLNQPELTQADPYQVWAVLRDGVPVCALNEGAAFYPDGYQLTLMELPSSAEGQIASYLLRRVPG